MTASYSIMMGPENFSLNHTVQPPLSFGPGASSMSSRPSITAVFPAGVCSTTQRERSPSKSSLARISPGASPAARASDAVTAKADKSRVDKSKWGTVMMNLIVIAPK